MKYDFDFSVYTINGAYSEELYSNIENLVYVGNRLNELSDNLNKIQFAVAYAANRLELYVQNVITKDFDAYEQTLAFDNKKLYIYDNKIIDNTLLELELSGTDVEDDMDISNYLPKTEHVYTVTRKQQILCEKLLDRYNDLSELINCYIAEYEDCQQYHTSIVKELISYLPKYEILDITKNNNHESFNEEIHSFVIVSSKSNKYKLFYVDKKHKDIFIKKAPTLSL
jgi:hypothetical protein